MTLNIHGTLLDLSTPQVMGIVNLTPDSFYAGSRVQLADDVVSRVRSMLNDGASIIDVGAYSTRPGAAPVPVEEEMGRLRKGLEAISKAVPEAIISIDTFRADVAKMCVEEYGAAIINDIAGGELDPQMFQTIAKLHVPYIIMHGGKEMIESQSGHGGPSDYQYSDLMETLMLYFSERVNRLHEIGVCDVIVDPGFGFAKNLEQNYQLMAALDELHELECPLLVGISRKTMIWRLLNTCPEQALNGTTVLNTIALMKGAHILRVHDVKPCAEAIRIYTQYSNSI